MDASAHTSATRTIALASRLVIRTIAISGLSNARAYCRFTRRPITGACPGTAEGSTTKTTRCEPRLAA